MAIDDEEQRKAVSGIVTPDSSKGADWRRQVSGVYSFGGGGGSQPDGATLMSPSFSAIRPPLPILVLIGG